MRSNENNSCLCGDRLDLVGPRSNRSGDTFLENLESAMAMRKIAALIVGIAYLACAISVALHPHNLWDLGSFLVFTCAGNFLIVVGLLAPQHREAHRTQARSPSTRWKSG